MAADAQALHMDIDCPHGEADGLLERILYTVHDAASHFRNASAVLDDDVQIDDDGVVLHRDGDARLGVNAMQQASPPIIEFRSVRQAHNAITR